MDLSHPTQVRLEAQIIEIYADGVQDDNPVENTHNNDENQHEDSNEYEPSLCIGNKGEQ